MTSGGAYGEDKARYVVDVGVCEPGMLPTSKKEQKEWLAIDNQFLITFVEAKKLTIYPTGSASWCYVAGCLNVCLSA